MVYIRFFNEARSVSTSDDPDAHVYVFTETHGGKPARSLKYFL